MYVSLEVVLMSSLVGTLSVNNATMMTTLGGFVVAPPSE